MARASWGGLAFGLYAWGVAPFKRDSLFRAIAPLVYFFCLDVAVRVFKSQAGPGLRLSHHLSSDRSGQAVPDAFPGNYCTPHLQV